MRYIDKLMEALKEACMEEKTVITFGMILDLLDRDETEVTLFDLCGNNLTGSADSPLWESLEDMAVQSIHVEDNGLQVVAEYEEDDDEA